MDKHRVYQIVEVGENYKNRSSKLTLATNDTESHLNIFLRDEEPYVSYCLTPDSARILRDGLLEFYPLPEKAAQPAPPVQESQRYEARQSMVSRKWVVERVISGLEHVVDCANKADALRVTGVLNDIKVW